MNSGRGLRPDRVREASATIAALFRRSVEALNRDELEAADADARQLRAIAPKDPAVHQLIAQIRSMQSRLPEAEVHVRTSLAARPDHLPTLMLGAQIARAAGDLALAGARLERATVLAPDLAQPAFEACLVRIISGQTEHDLPLDELARRFPQHGAGWIDLGHALEGRGLGAAALAAYRRAEPTLPSAALYSAMAGLLHEAGEAGAAEQALIRAVEIDASHVPAWFRLGLVRQDRRDLEGAISAYRQALALRPDMAEVETNLGIVLQETGDLAAAKRAYGRAILLRGGCFGPIAQALTMAPTGELWLDLAALRAHLCDEGRLPR